LLGALEELAALGKVGGDLECLPACHILTVTLAKAL